MKLQSIFLLGLVLFGSLAATAAQSAEPKAPPEGYVSLFDGKSLAGWELMNNAKFVAEDGVLKLHGGSGWLKSEKEFADFDLQLEVRWLKPRQDSGIFLRSSKEGKNWPDRKYEVQCENSERIVFLFGAKHDRKADVQKLLKEPGEWHTMQITCRGAQCEVRFQGESVVTSESLKPGSGFLGIQGENGELEFRNLFIKTLDAAK